MADVGRGGSKVVALPVETAPLSQIFVRAIRGVLTDASTSKE